MTELYMCNKENRKFSPALEARWTGSTGGVSDMTTGVFGSFGVTLVKLEQAKHCKFTLVYVLPMVK